MGSIVPFKKKTEDFKDWPSGLEETENFVVNTLKEAVEKIVDGRKEKESHLEIRINSLESEFKELKETIENKPFVKNTTIYDIDSEKYSLKIPLGILLEIYKDEVVAKFPEIEVWGSGAIEGEAINDLKLQLVTVYEELLQFEKENRLGKLPKMWLRALTNILEKKK
jgi:hypothetical protein